MLKGSLAAMEIVEFEPHPGPRVGYLRIKFLKTRNLQTASFFMQYRKGIKMAEKTTGTKNQDKVADPHFNESPDANSEAKKQEIKDSGAESESQPVPKRNQENLQNRGLEEDQPQNPVRSTGSLDAEQQEDKYRQPGDKYQEDADKISS